VKWSALNSQIIAAPAAIWVFLAIPINIALDTAPTTDEKGPCQSRAYRRADRRVDKDLAESLGLPNNKGAIVSEVVKDVRRKAGIKEQDIILRATAGGWTRTPTSCAR